MLGKKGDQTGILYGQKWQLFLSISLTNQKKFVKIG